MLHSGFVSADSVTRIWKGYVWRDSYYRYYLQEDEEYRINRRFTKVDGSYDPPFGVVWYRDFSDLNNRFKPRPDGLYEIRKYNNVHSYYLPVNFSRAALDTLYWVPKDDRPYLIVPIVEVEVEPIEEEGEEEEVKKPRISSDGSGSSGSGSSGSISSGDQEISTISTQETSTISTQETSTISTQETSTIDIVQGEIQTIDDGYQGDDHLTKALNTVTGDDALSSDATLSSLSVTAGTETHSISLNLLQKVYHLNVAKGTSDVSVSVETNHPRASFDVSLNGTTISGVGELTREYNALVVEVTAEDGNTTRTYTVTVQVSNPQPPRGVGISSSVCDPRSDSYPPTNGTCLYDENRACAKGGGGGYSSSIREVWRDGSCVRYECNLDQMDCKETWAEKEVSSRQSCQEQLDMGRWDYANQFSDDCCYSNGGWESWKGCGSELDYREYHYACYEPCQATTPCFYEYRPTRNQ